MKVGLFVTCLVDLMRPSIGFATLKLLESAGCEVVAPQTQTCCGQPGYNAGDRVSALALARKVLDEFEVFDYVVAPSGSCAGMIRTHYPDLFRGEPELARVNALCAVTYELTEFLVDVLKVSAAVMPLLTPSKDSSKKSIKTYTYHDSCSGLRELGVKSQPRALLAQTAGITLKEMDECETCCGFGGMFAVKYGDISTHIADRKCENIAKCDVDAVVLGDLGCMLNIEGRLRRRGDMKTQVLHVAEVLAGDEFR
ncbi:MAG: (Fe-S)-binding protein [Burkholderiales bacterium]